MIQLRQKTGRNLRLNQKGRPGSVQGLGDLRQDLDQLRELALEKGLSHHSLVEIQVCSPSFPVSAVAIFLAYSASNSFCGV